MLGNASFAFARCLIASFDKFSVCTDICGPVGGRVLPTCQLNSEKSYPDFPVECVLSEQKIAQLSGLGLLPLAINKRINELVFSAAGSIRWGNLATPTTRSPSELLDAQVEAQLPYLFVISRIAHYLKVVLRDDIGSLKTITEVQSELNRWLRRYISDVENPAPGVRTRKPLKIAEVVLQETTSDGRYQMSLSVVPHMKYMGSDFVLALTFLTD